MTPRTTAGGSAERPSDAVQAGSTAYDEMTNHKREQLAVAGLQHLVLETAALVNLRGRVATAVVILSRDADVQRALAVLRGEQPW